jgi:hypothetical protein
MPTEPTNNSNQPTPPINQDGVAIPYKAPTPPSSVNLKDDNSLGKFFSEIEKLKDSVETINKLLKTQAILLKDVTDQQSENIKVKENFAKETTQALDANTASIKEAQKAQEELKNSLLNMKVEIGESRPDIKTEIENIVIESIEASNTQKETEPQNKKDISAILRQQNTEQFASNPNIQTINQIKEQINSLVKPRIDEFKSKNPEATEEQIAKETERIIIITKEDIRQDLIANKDPQTDQSSVAQERHEQLLEALNNMQDLNVDQVQMEHERFDEEASGKLRTEKMTKELLENSKELNKTAKESKPWYKSLIGLVMKLVLGFLLFAGPGVIVGAVVGAVSAYFTQMVKRFLNIIEFIFRRFDLGLTIIEKIKGVFQFGFSNLFKPITNALKRLDNIVSVGILKNFFPSFLKGLAPSATALIGFVGISLKYLGQFVPLLGVVGGVLGSIGKFGIFLKFFFVGMKTAFAMVSKIFFPIQILLSLMDAIIGGFKGFEKLGIKGAIMGAIAEIISGLLMGVISFEDTFNFLNFAFGDIFSALAEILQPIIDMFAYFYETIKSFFASVFKIFTGGDNIVVKIFKIILLALSTALKLLISTLVTTVKLAFLIFIKLPYTIGEWMSNTLMDMSSWLWNWFTTGDWLDDISNFGTWLYDNLVSMFEMIINSIADGLGDIPLIGGSIKEALGGGSKNKEMEYLASAATVGAKVVEESSNVPQKIAASVKEKREEDGRPKHLKETSTPPSRIGKAPGGVQYANMSSQSYNANAVNTATTNASTAQFNATKQNNPTNISAPTTNVLGGGGGGESIMLSPTSNRNTEPTFRALLFQECPSL